MKSTRMCSLDEDDTASREVMRRKASDNEYLHKDFHGALSVGIEYLHRNYGPEAVREYLRQFTRLYYAHVTEAIMERGLPALREFIESIYAIEDTDIKINLSKDSLVIEVDACPAVMHMRKHGYHVSELFHETVKTFNEALCEGTPFAAELVLYEPQTGKSIQRFFRRLA